MLTYPPVIMDENMQPIAVHNEKTEQHKRSSNNSSDTEPTTNNKQLTRDILLQKQREQQTSSDQLILVILSDESIDLINEMVKSGLHRLKLQFHLLATKLKA